MKQLLIPLAALALLLSQCKKNDPESALPAETQTGANTFGCLVNGQAWLPGGNDGTSNYSVYYDPTYAQGTFGILTYRLTGNGADQQTIGINSDSMRTTGTYKFQSTGRTRPGFGDRRTGCHYYATDPGTYCKGMLTITRLDYQAGVVSGTFAFTLAKPGCDTVRVTQGRFDKHL